MNANALTEAVATVDRHLADWLETVVVLVELKRNQYWRGEIQTIEWQKTLDDAFAEMRDVARILRTRPISKEGKR